MYFGPLVQLVFKNCRGLGLRPQTPQIYKPTIGQKYASNRPYITVIWSISLFRQNLHSYIY